LQGRLEQLGVYVRERRRWLPHVTVVRFRDQPRLRPPVPDLGEVVPSDAAAFISQLRPTGAQYLVVESFALGGR
jgi:2'-5' RNA ligase